MLSFRSISKLQVRVFTSNDSSAGTNNDVYFDIGPIGWELLKSGNQFEAGAIETYDLTFDNSLSLTTDDIVWVRLQKKGMGGYYGTPEGIGGGWKPNKIDLIVDGLTLKTFHINRWLDNSNPTWKRDVRSTWSDARRFARTTRLLPNAKLGLVAESAAGLSSQVKISGISGWLGTNFPQVCATGTVVRPPGISTDGLATIDLKLDLLNINGRRYRFDSGHGIRGPRFLRVEYFFMLDFQTVPTNGQCVEICGVLKWDTDNEGWYEIHPHSSKDVKLLGSGECSVKSLPSPSKLSLRAAIESDFPNADLSLGLKALDPALGSKTLSVRELIKSSAF